MSINKAVRDLLYLEPVHSTSPFYDLATRVRTDVPDPLEDDLEEATIVALVALFTINSYEDAFRQAAGNLLLELVKHSQSTRNAITGEQSTRKPIVETIITDGSHILRIIGASIVDHLQQFYLYRPTAFFPKDNRNAGQTFPNELGSDWTRAFDTWLKHIGAGHAEKDVGSDAFYAIGIKSDDDIPHRVHHDEEGRGTIICVVRAEHLTCARVTVEPAKSSWFLDIPVYAIARSFPRQQQPVPSGPGYPMTVADQVSLELNENATDVKLNGNVRLISSLLILLGKEEDAKDISEVIRSALKAYDIQHNKRKDLRVSTSATQFNCTTDTDSAVPAPRQVVPSASAHMNKGGIPVPRKQQDVDGSVGRDQADSASKNGEEAAVLDLQDTDIVHDSHGFSQDRLKSQTAAKGKKPDVVKSKPTARAETKTEDIKVPKGQGKLRHRMNDEANGQTPEPEPDGKKSTAARKSNKAKPVEDGETQLFFDSASGKKPSVSKTYKAKTNAREKKVSTQQLSKPDSQALGKRKTRSSLLADTGALDELPPAKRSAKSRAPIRALQDDYEVPNDDEDEMLPHEHQVKKQSIKTEKASTKGQSSVGTSTKVMKKSQASTTVKAATSSKSVTQPATSSRKQHLNANTGPSSHSLKKAKTQPTVEHSVEDYDEDYAAMNGVADHHPVPASTGKLRSIDKSVPKFAQMSNGEANTQSTNKKPTQSKASISMQKVRAEKATNTQTRSAPSTKATRDSQTAPKSTTTEKRTAARSEKVPVIDLETPQPRQARHLVSQSASTAQLPDDAANRKAQLVSFSVSGPRNQGSRSPRKAVSTAKGLVTEPQGIREEAGDAETSGLADEPNGAIEPSLEQSHDTNITYDLDDTINVADEDSFGPNQHSSPPEDLYADRLGSQLSQRVSGEGSPHRKGLRLPVADIRGGIRSNGPPTPKASQIKAAAASVTPAPVETNLPPSRNPDNDIGRRPSLPAVASALKLSQLHPSKGASHDATKAADPMKDPDALLFKKPTKPAQKPPASATVPTKPSSQAKPSTSKTAPSQDGTAQRLPIKTLSQNLKAAEKPISDSGKATRATAADTDVTAPKARASAQLQPSVRVASQHVDHDISMAEPPSKIKDRPEEAAHAAAKAVAASIISEEELPSRGPSLERIDDQENLEPRDLLADPLHEGREEIRTVALPSEAEQVVVPSSSAGDDVFEVSRPPAKETSSHEVPTDAEAEAPQPDDVVNEPEPTPKPERSLFADFLARKSSQPVAPGIEATTATEEILEDSDQTLVEEHPDAVLSETEHVADEHWEAEAIEVGMEGYDAAEEDVRMSDHSSDSDARSMVSEHDQKSDNAEETVSEPEEDPAFTAYRDFMAWEEALDPHQKEYHDVFARISKQIISHILDTETSALSTISDYEKGGSALITQLEESHAVEAETYDVQMKQAGMRMRTHMIDMLAELDEGGRRAKETMKQVRDWEGGWYQESENAITELDRLIETWG